MDINYLSQYANLSITDKDEITNAYRTIINDRLFKESNDSLIDSMYSLLNTQIIDSMLIKNISEIHFEGLARFYAQKSDFKKSLEYSSKCYEINPLNVNTQSLITQSLIQDFSRRTGSASTLNKMDENQKKFSFLRENSLYQSLYFFTYAYNAFNYLRADDVSTGLRYIEKMESLLEQFGDELKYDENQFGLAYAEAGAAYFRKRQYKKAKAIIEKGLEIMPDHPELKIRLQIVNDEMR